MVKQNRFNRQLKKHLLLLLLPCTLISCVHKADSNLTVFTQQESELRDVALSVEQSLRVLAAAKNVNMDTALNTEHLMQPGSGLSEKITIDWSGPIQPLIQQLADISHYNLKVFGTEPPIPIIVSVSSSNTPIADVLKDTGLQAGSRANVVVFPRNRIIELRYVKV